MEKEPLRFSYLHKKLHLLFTALINLNRTPTYENFENCVLLNNVALDTTCYRALCTHLCYFQICCF